MTLSDSVLSRLKDPSLAVDKALIAGEWVAASDGGSTFDVTNPSTGEVLATLPDMNRAEARRAIEAAYAVQKAWAKKTGKERAAVLRKLFDLIVQNADDLATILTLEMGKPFLEARGEILYGACYIEWFGEEAKRLYGDVIPGPPFRQAYPGCEAASRRRRGYHPLEFPERHAGEKDGSGDRCRVRDDFKARKRDAAFRAVSRAARRTRRSSGRHLQCPYVQRLAFDWQGVHRKRQGSKAHRYRVYRGGTGPGAPGSRPDSQTRFGVGR